MTRRHPDLNRGKKDLQSSALPLGHVAKKNRWQYDPFFVWGGLLNFFFFCTCILNPVCLNQNPFLIRSAPSIDCIVSQNTQYLKTSPILSIEKKNVDFLSQKNALKIGTINYWLVTWLRIHDFFFYLDLKLCFPNDIRNSK